jgi:hypothetical protein
LTASRERWPSRIVGAVENLKECTALGRHHGSHCLLELLIVENLRRHAAPGLFQFRISAISIPIRIGFASINLEVRGVARAAG